MELLLPAVRSVTLILHSSSSACVQRQASSGQLVAFPLESFGSPFESKSNVNLFLTVFHFRDTCRDTIPLIGALKKGGHS